MLYASRVFAYTQVPKFNNMASTDTFEKLYNQFEKIWYAMDQSTSSIVFTAGFCTTIVFKPWQILPNHCVIVVVYFTNHFLPFGDKYYEDILSLMK